MRAFIIITTSPKDLWKENTSDWHSSCEACNEDEMDAFKLRSKEITEDKVVLVFCEYWPNSTRSEGEILEAIQRETAKRVLKVMRLHPIAEMSIAAHGASVDWDQVEQEVDAIKLSRQEFPHEPGHELYDKIVKLTKTPTEESFEAAQAEVKKKGR